MTDRRVTWPGFVNARTLAGVPVAGGVIREGSLFRSERPGLHGDPTGAPRALAAAGVTVVVNLRSGPEGDDVDVLRDHPGRIGLPIVDPSGAHVETTATEQGGVYLDILRGTGPALTSVLRHLATAPPGGVLVHCTAGKDRTGLVIALLLKALGATDDDVADDYTLTKDNLAPFHDAWVASLEPGPFKDRVTGSDHNAPREAMVTVLRWLAEQGGAAAYLRAHGLTDAELTALRERFVAPV